MGRWWRGRGFQGVRGASLGPQLLVHCAGIVVTFLCALFLIHMIAQVDQAFRPCIVYLDGPRPEPESAAPGEIIQVVGIAQTPHAACRAIVNESAIYHVSGGVTIERLPGLERRFGPMEFAQPKRFSTPYRIPYNAQPGTPWRLTSEVHWDRWGLWRLTQVQEERADVVVHVR